MGQGCNKMRKVKRCKYFLDVLYYPKSQDMTHHTEKVSHIQPDPAATAGYI